MCTNGINTNQLTATIEQIDETVALVRRWTHRCYHLAADGQMERSAAQLQKVQGMLDDVRSALDEATAAIEKDDAEQNAVEVKLV
jgi:hypothetical protein